MKPIAKRGHFEKGWYVVCDEQYLHKTDLKFHPTTWGGDSYDGYYRSKREAQKYIKLYNERKENKMYKLKNGNTISSETVDLAVEAYMKDHPDKKPFSEWIYQFRVDVRIGESYPIVIGFETEFTPSDRMDLNHTTKSAASVKQIIKVLQKAVDFAENNK